MSHDPALAPEPTPPSTPLPEKPRLLAVASGGGHWDEMLILRPAFVEYDVVYATTMAGQAERDGIRAELVTDSNRDSNPFTSLKTLWHVLGLVRRHRPRAVVSTGAMPGFFAVLIGKLFGARTVWIDSVANAEHLSMSGKLAVRIVDLHLTQWPHLAGGKTKYLGSIL